jgi:hypothetical protein
MMKRREDEKSNDETKRPTICRRRHNLPNYKREKLKYKSIGIVKVGQVTSRSLDQ